MKRWGLCGFLLAYAATAAELARWEAASPTRANAIQLSAAPGSKWSIDGDTARLQPSADYYTRSAFELSIAVPAGSPRWLVLEFPDTGYGLISISPGVSQSRQWGVARVNSGKVRRAVFQFDGALPEKLRIESLPLLRAVMIVDQQPAVAPAPLVAPAVRFETRSERVSSVAGDSADPSKVAEALAGLRNELPLLRALGFNGVETYVRWGLVERVEGVYDWSYYDAILDAIEQHGLQWFPMLLAGSGYALPAWLHDSPRNFGFRCLEHGIQHDTQSIFDPFQTEYASRFIAEFGKHYRTRNSLLGIRLGPSGDYGEAQYPAKGPGYGFQDHHTHIGYWAGDTKAQADFRAYLKKEYGDITRLNAAWSDRYESFDKVSTFLPETAVARRKRLDFDNWYMGAMSDWCEKWAVWARAALPDTVIHQSSGGWGLVEVGTDYSYQARSMAKVHGGMRLTNEGDDYPDNFTITRMASSAARFYGIPLGYEPGGYGSKRGVMARLFNMVTNGGVHLFYYLGNLTANDQAIDAWLRHAKVIDQRARPVIDVAAFYPDTALKLDDELVRYRWASTYFTVARTLREEVDFDYASEQMVLDGALDRYRVLLFLWGSVTERPVLERIDRWVRNGGTLVFAPRPRGNPITVEGDQSIASRWLSGDTGKGRVVVWHGDLIPSQSYARFIHDLLLRQEGIRPAIRNALSMTKPARVFWSVLENGRLLLLNFSDDPASVTLQGGRRIEIPPYEMAVEAAL